MHWGKTQEISGTSSPPLQFQVTEGSNRRLASVSPSSSDAVRGAGYRGLVCLLGSPQLSCIARGVSSPADNLSPEFDELALGHAAGFRGPDDLARPGSDLDGLRVFGRNRDGGDWNDRNGSDQEESKSHVRDRS